MKYFLFLPVPVLKAILLWLMVAISLFNVILLLWLGLTVLLNAGRRSWGTWLAASGLILGGGFFLAHTAALDFTLDNLMETAPWWWPVLSVPIMALPYGWLVLMLWYCGYWDEGGETFKRRARPSFLGTTGLFIFLANLMVWSAPTLGRTPFTDMTPANDAPFIGIRAILLLYPLFLLLCTGASLDALARPAPSNSFMGDEARRRARPWLLASSLVQFLASIGVAAILLFTAYLSMGGALYNIASQMSRWTDVADFFIQGFIAVAVMLLGKAVVSYEIFTGKILPRRGFWRQWRAVVLLAAGYSGVVAGSLFFLDSPVFMAILTTLLMSIFVALASFRAYGERERAVSDLRAFVASQHLYDGLVSGDTVQLQNALDEPFRALCRDVLNAAQACLVARGPMAPLAGQPRLYPADLEFRPEWNDIVAHGFASPCASLPPETGMAWVVPLGSQRDGSGQPLGVLLLGEKLDGGLYTLEEIEVARSAGEHLLDVGAGATLAGRLMTLQRQKLAEVQMLDRRARRVLHDDILPQLHAALLTLGGHNAPSEAIDALTSAHRGISDLLREMPASISPTAKRGVVGALRYEVEGELAGKFDEVVWHIEPNAEAALDALPSLIGESVFFAAREAVRNAAKYGRGDDVARQLNLTIVARCREQLEIEIADDGMGMGVSTSAPQGTGHGLALHGTLLAVAGGQLSVENGVNGGTKVALRLPVGE